MKFGEQTGRIRGVSMAFGALVAGALLAFTPAVTHAQGCSLNGTPVNGVIPGVLLEVMETPPAQAAPGGPTLAGAFPPGIGGRLAQATETGNLGAGCGTLAGFAGPMEVHAQSRIPVDPTTGDFGTGPISGVFHIDTATGSIVGKLDGILDFSPTNHNVTLCLGGPCPFAKSSGTWSTLGNDKTAGGFAGLALIPFQMGGAWFYLDPTGALGAGVFGIVPLGEGDFSKQFGTPLAKFVISLYQ